MSVSKSVSWLAPPLRRRLSPLSPLLPPPTGASDPGAEPCTRLGRRRLLGLYRRTIHLIVAEKGASVDDGDHDPPRQIWALGHCCAGLSSSLRTKAIVSLNAVTRLVQVEKADEGQDSFPAGEGWSKGRALRLSANREGRPHVMASSRRKAASSSGPCGGDTAIVRGGSTAADNGLPNLMTVGDLVHHVEFNVLSTVVRPATKHAQFAGMSD
jgi:hypothetical protein